MFEHNFVKYNNLEKHKTDVEKYKNIIGLGIIGAIFIVFLITTLPKIIKYGFDYEVMFNIVVYGVIIILTLKVMRRQYVKEKKHQDKKDKELLQRQKIRLEMKERKNRLRMYSR
jgi:amino acid transporter